MQNTKKAFNVFRYSPFSLTALIILQLYGMLAIILNKGIFFIWI